MADREFREKIIGNADEGKYDDEYDSTEDFDMDLDFVDNLESVIVRKQNEVKELRAKISHAESETDKQKHSELMDYLSWEIESYAAVRGKIIDDDYDPDFALDSGMFDRKIPESYDEYYDGLSEEDRATEILAQMSKENYYRTSLEDVYYSFGYTVLSNRRLVNAVMEDEYIVAGLGRLVSENPEIMEKVFDAAEKDMKRREREERRAAKRERRTRGR